MQRLNFGCSDVQPEDWVNLDRDDCGQEYRADLLDGLPFDNNYFDGIVSNHSLQCIRFDDLQRALAELKRVLKVGGTLRILVPDFEWALKMWNRCTTDELPISDEVEYSDDGKLLRYLFWHGDARSCFTETSLIDTLSRNGFQNVLRVDPGETNNLIPEIVALDSREQESLIMEAIK